MQNVRQIGRRVWLARMVSGLMAVWAGLDLGGRDGWAVLIGSRPRTVDAAAQPAAQFLRARSFDDFRVWSLTDHVFNNVKGTGNVQAYVVVRGQEAAIVDTLLVNNAGTIQEVLRSAGLGYDAVRHVILTHYHLDHAGSAAEIAALATHATFYAGALDVPALAVGNTRGQDDAVYPNGAPPFRQQVRPVGDGDEVFGLQIFNTPGHTAGHISVLDPATATLITGDAILNNGGDLTGPNPSTSADIVVGARSMQKLAGLKFERALFMHGQEITTGASAALVQIVQRYPRASDGQSLERQSPQTRSAFAAVYGDRDGAEWVRQHEAELKRGSGSALVASGPHGDAC
jgi:glyoxylase-like metal-dependent hydrolase (beta-lactamase superfamily II)